jgi:hypothetical protein
MRAAWVILAMLCGLATPQDGRAAYHTYWPAQDFFMGSFTTGWFWSNGAWTTPTSACNTQGQDNRTSGSGNVYTQGYSTVSGTDTDWWKSGTTGRTTTAPGGEVVEGGRKVLGHLHVDTTRLYGERDILGAAAIMARLG